MEKKLQWLLILALQLACTLVFAQTGPMPVYSREQVMIPMRDGIKLHTLIYRPKANSNKLPFLFSRTPYGAQEIIEPGKNDYVGPMAKEGYIFVYQDIRGHYQSEGTYVMMRPSLPRNQPGTDESTDTYDTIDWLLKNIPDNNGKVGMYGISYDGWTTVMGTIKPHPALVAASEQASPADMYMGDDFHHNGAFRLSYGFEYVFSQEAAKTDTLYPFPNYDTYDWYLRLGPLLNINQKYLHGQLPTWNNFVAHPNYDSFWQQQAVAPQIDTSHVHMMNVAGWWDQEDFYGPLKIYKTLEEKGAGEKNMIVIGPWNHGEWAYWSGDALGNIKFGTPTSDKFRTEIQAPWFAYYLKGEGNGQFAKAIIYQTGSNVWKTYKQWPPAEVTTKNIYLHSGGGLSFSSPEKTEKPFSAYLSDPAHPLPYRPRPVEETYGHGSRWGSWLTEDQRFVKDRPDMLSFETGTLTTDLTVTGDLLAKIYAATSGTDADWIVKLIDVYPEEYPAEPQMAGYELMVANEIFRGRFRKSFEKPEAIIAGKVELYPIDLHAINHVFKKGHKIMVQVQSSWFPVYDRNPQKFVLNIFKAEAKDYQQAVQQIYTSPQYPSHIVLPVVEN
jgi:putative CocE/NonD family hydrolase